MERTPVRIKLEPVRCDRCRKCMAVCDADALKVGPAYLYLDWRTCTECMRCVDACGTGAITRLEHSRHDAPEKRPAPRRSGTTAFLRALFHRAKADGAAAVAPSAVPAPAVAPSAAPAPAPPPAPLPVPEVPEAAPAPMPHDPASAPRKPAPMSRQPAPAPPAMRTRQATTATRTRSVVPSDRPVRRAIRRPRELSTGPVIWSLVEAAAIIAVAFAALFAKDAVLGARVVTSLSDQGRILVRVAVLGFFYAVQFVMLGYLAHRRGATLPGSLGLSRVRATFGSWMKAVGWVALLLVTTRLAAWVWGIASRAVGFDPPMVPQGGFAQVFGAGWAGLALSIALVVIIAPIAEEMVFRGIILGALGARWGARVGLLGSAMIFALYHLTPWQIVPIFVLGLACGWLTQHRGSLWPAITLHVLYNAVPVALAFVGTAG